MTMILRQRPGMTITREGGRIIKQGSGTANEARLLRALNGCGYTPQLLDEGDGWIAIEDLGETEPISDIPLFLEHCAGLLLALKEADIRHGDLTRRNIIVRNNRPHAIDFEQSRFLSERGEDKRPGDDACWLMLAAAELIRAARKGQP